VKTKAHSLYTTYCNCLDTLKTRETDFRQLEMATNPEHLAKWSAMDDTPGKDGKKVISVHVARYKKGISFSEILNDTHITLYEFHLFQDHQHKERPTKHFWQQK
jgi:hypothetical protein